MNKDQLGDVPAGFDEPAPLDSNPEPPESTSGPGTTDDDHASQEETLVAAQDSPTAHKHKVVPLPSVEDRQRKGRVARAESPPESLSTWRAPADRADPVALVTGQDASRVQALVPVRHSRMSASAFTFYRGAALVMATDLATCPRSGLQVQLCGDAHLSNFGLYGSPDRSVVFDVNDFDETNPGPFEWDVMRLAASFVLAARDNMMKDKEGAAAAQRVGAAYRQAMAVFAQKPEIDIWYARVDDTNIVNWMKPASSGDAKTDKKSDKKKDGKKKGATVQSAFSKATAKARSRDAWSAVMKLTEVVDGRRQFRTDPPVLVRISDDQVNESLTTQFLAYRATLQDDRQSLIKRYEIIDVGHKVVGVGSVGLRDFVLLMRGRDDQDLMVLQVKQAQASVLEAFTHNSVFSKHGHRVVTGQRALQATSDSFLGWEDASMLGHSYYVRQLRDMKWSPDPAQLIGDRLQAYADLCGRTLARAHARSGDAIAIAAYIGDDTSFDTAIASFAMSYADQAAQDFEAFTAAIADGRVAAHEDAEGDDSVKAAQQLGQAPQQEAPKTPAKL
jgi:uncharacterized protein (DUF2252 family)